MDKAEQIMTLANQKLHDYELAMCDAESDEEADMWEQRIEALEDRIEFLHTTTTTKLASQIA